MRSRNTLLALTGAWFLAQAYLASLRSLSSDEWPKFDYVTTLPFIKALYMHMSELAPYAPGEILIGWVCRHVGGLFLPDELWARLPALLFGSLAVGVALSLELPFLALPLLFSVSLTSFATQFQPYCAMIFGGALAFKLLWRAEESATTRRLAWFNLFFGHLYGICFVAMAYFFRRQWRKVAAAGVFVVACLALHVVLRRPFAPLHAAFPPALAILKQTLGALTNPHKAALFYVPLALLGLVFAVRRRGVGMALRLAAYFGATVLAPMAASKVGDYIFLPRQVVGGLVGTLALVALGYELIREKLAARAKAKRVALGALWAASAAFAVLPWADYVRGVPPFVDQPLHRFKQLTRELADSGARNVLWGESGTSGSGVRYFERIFGKATEQPAENYSSHGFALQKVCWRPATRPGLCMHVLTDPKFVYEQEALFASGAFLDLLNSGDPVRFDAFVHSLPRLELKTAVRLERTW